MTTEGWIFMVGFRIFDVGLLILWLIWFFRLRDDGDNTPGDDGGGGEGPDRGPRRDGPGGGGVRLPIGRFAPGGRMRDHRPTRPRRRRRGDGPLTPRPLPARVRQPRGPVPARRAAL